MRFFDEKKTVVYRVCARIDFTTGSADASAADVRHKLPVCLIQSCGRRPHQQWAGLRDKVMFSVKRPRAVVGRLETPLSKINLVRSFTKGCVLGDQFSLSP